MSILVLCSAQCHRHKCQLLYASIAHKKKTSKLRKQILEVSSNSVDYRFLRFLVMFPHQWKNKRRVLNTVKVYSSNCIEASIENQSHQFLLESMCREHKRSLFGRDLTSGLLFDRQRIEMCWCPKLQEREPHWSCTEDGTLTCWSRKESILLN